MGDISTNDPHSYKYGGKELDRDFGIDLFDFEARQYDAKVPGFTSIDPLAEKYYSISPYAYCAGDPVNLVDPDGKAIIFVNGFRPGVGWQDQTTNPEFGRYKLSSGARPYVYKRDEMSYWESRLINYYMDQFNDKNTFFTSGSASVTTNAWQRATEGKAKALMFHKMVQVGDIKLEEDEPIRIITHSMGGAAGAGMAQKLIELGYKVEIIEYITPHQAKDIKHPQGVKGIQYNQVFDRVVTRRGIIPDINKIVRDWRHFFRLLGGHENGHNVDTVTHGEDIRNEH